MHIISLCGFFDHSEFESKYLIVVQVEMQIYEFTNLLGIQDSVCNMLLPQGKS